MHCDFFPWKKKSKYLFVFPLLIKFWKGEKITGMLFIIGEADYTQSKSLYYCYKIWSLYNLICVIKGFS